MRLGAPCELRARTLPMRPARSRRRRAASACALVSPIQAGAERGRARSRSSGRATSGRIVIRIRVARLAVLPKHFAVLL
jgi:hypothetical protein